MNKLIGAALAAAPILMVAGTANAVTPTDPHTSQASASVTTTIIQPISVANTGGVGLAFGTIVKPVSGSDTVTVDNSGNISTGTGAAVALTNSSTHSAAAFTVSGEAGQAFTLAVPSTVALSGPGSITVNTTNNAACSPDLAHCALSGTAPGTGTLAFNVGGSFTLPSSQATGAYTGSVTVTATYN